MQIHILGTSSSRPAHGRSVSGTAINTNKGIIIVDCGEGFQERIYNQNKKLKERKLEFRIKTGKINTILLTHGHLDHTWGLLPLLKTLSLDGREKEMTIIAPTSHEIVNRILKSNDPFIEINDLDISNVDLYNQFQQWWSLGGTTESLNYCTNWILIGIDENDEIGLFNGVLIDPDNKKVEKITNLLDYTNGIEILSIPTLHSVPSCGWWIKETNKKGKFDSEMAKQNNLNLEQIQSLAKGIEIEGHLPSDYRMNEEVGPSVLISGDTAGKNKGFEKLSKMDLNTTILIHEATFLEENKDRANKYLHSTALEAAQSANLISAKHLIITHFSSRIKDTNVLISEASKEFKSVHAASDSEIINIKNQTFNIIS